MYDHFTESFKDDITALDYREDYSYFSQDSKHYCKEAESWLGEAVPHPAAIYHSVESKTKGHEIIVWWLGKYI